MATQDLKTFLSEQTNTPENQWKRLSKHKDSDGNEIRLFENKVTGQQILTKEDTQGQLSIVNNNACELPVKNSSTNSDDKAHKQAVRLIKNFYEEGDVDESKPGFNQIPTLFKFCFLEDANPDHTQALEETAQAGDKTAAVTGFNIFFSPTIRSLDSAIHLSGLIESFLPSFMNEVEEQSFSIDGEYSLVYDDDRINGLKNGTIPHIAYDQIVATLEKAGFTYDIKNCALKDLGGSQGATPIIEIAPPVQDTKFCIIKVKNERYDPNNSRDCPYHTGVLMDAPVSYNDRKKQARFLQQNLKNFTVGTPGRVMNGNFPQMEIFQIYNKKSYVTYTYEEDRQRLHAELIASGFIEDKTLASEERANKWTLEQWAVTPMPKLSGGITMIHHGPQISDHTSQITYEVWENPKPKMKP